MRFLSRHNTIITKQGVPDSGVNSSSTSTTSDDMASKKVSLMGWSLFFIAVLEGVVLFLKEYYFV
jgi:hypothetical protein